jgi:hypothetical protein
LAARVAAVCLLAACGGGDAVERKPDAGANEPELDADSDASESIDGASEEMLDATLPTLDASEAGPRVAAWTVLVYMAADNNLEKAGIDDLNEMLEVGASDDVQVIVEIDRTTGFYDLGVGNVGNWDTLKRFRVAGGKLEELADLGELSTGAPHTLSDFLSWGFRTFPAQRRAIVLWDHGNAWRGYGGDDTSDKDLLDQLEIGQAIADGISQAGLKTVDVIGFDACLMSSAATAQLAREFTRYMIASEELVPGNGWDYAASLQYLVQHPDADAPSFARAVIDSFYAQSRATGKHRDVTCNLLDLDKLPEVQTALAAFLDVAEAHLSDTSRDIADAHAHTLEYGHHADPTLTHHMRDLGDFARKLAAESALYQPASERLDKALKALVVSSVYGSNKQVSSGLSAYFPPQRAYYDASYDDVPQAERWRKFLAAYYAHAAAATHEPPAFQDAHEHHPVGEGSGELPAPAVGSCDPSEGPTLTAPLSGNDVALVAHATLLAGFIETATGKAHVFAREPAEVDATNHRVRGTWDRHVLVAQQGAHALPLFAEVTLDAQRRYVHAEIPFVYTEPTTCACAHLGEPGYSDVDGDGMPDCADDDVDADGVPDKASAMQRIDNCPWLSNPAQEDANKDGVGDACETSSGAPALSCTPQPTGDFGKLIPAVWRVLIDRHDRASEADTLYVMDEAGSAELTPEVGGVLWPRRIVVRPDGTTSFHTDPPLPFNLHDSVLFDYADSELLHVQNAVGDPLLDQNLKPISLLGAMGLSKVYLHLELDDFTGRGDVAVAIMEPDCDPPRFEVCPGAEEPDCEGRCIEAALVSPNGHCDDGTNGGVDLFCELFNFDGGECVRPGCGGGYVRDCNGQCTLTDAVLGNEVCDALAACGALGWDEGDCVCGPSCSGHGACDAEGCACSDGTSGTFCERPVSCGDGSCSATESCLTCALDCGACPRACGDGVCRRGDRETCATCAADCGSCACGDGVCSPGLEDCTSCTKDCGACPVCGDFECARWSEGAHFAKTQQEHCGNCPSDCGSCHGDCCAAAGIGGHSASRVGCAEPAIARCVCAMHPECCNTLWTADCAERAIRDCSLRCEACTDVEGADVDGDAVCGSIDNCPGAANAGQLDADEDDVGDLCDLCSGDDRLDADGDHIPDACDTCPHHANNPDQDSDHDGVADACDVCRTIPNANRNPRACIDANNNGVIDALECGASCAGCTPQPELCGDGIDQDCDGNADDGCVCTPTPEVCTNAIDDDCDRLIDEVPCIAP